MSIASASTTAIIRVESLRKTYQMGVQSVNALDGIDVEIQSSAFSVIMGPSGSGKSTLLHLMGGLDRPTSGKIEVNGQAIELLDENQLAVYRRQMIGFIFQSFNLIASMTALENVAFPMRFSRTPRQERLERARDLLKQVGLEDRAHHRPTELSGGQQQRVAVARALVNNPQLILADEPTGNLDSASGVSIMQMLAHLHQSGRTVVVVTHDPRMKHFCTHTVYLLDGKVVDEAAFEAAASLSSVLLP